MSDPPRRGWLRRCYDWVLRWAERPGGPAMLFGLAFIEAVFFPIPPDILLIALAFGAPTRAWRFAAICTAGSVLGGIAGYALGALAAPLGKSLLIQLAGLDAYYHVADVYSRNAFAALVIAGFTPVPYKVFAVSAGIFHEWVGLGTLVAASAVSRGARFFLVAACIRRFGPAVRPYLERHLGAATLVVGLGVVGGFVVLAGGAGQGAGEVRLRGLAAEVAGSDPTLRGQALALLAESGAPAAVTSAIDVERPPEAQPEAYGALRAWVESTAGPPPGDDGTRALAGWAVGTVLALLLGLALWSGRAPPSPAPPPEPPADSPAV